MTTALTHNSRSTHGALTESSVTTPTRKGREGKGSGIGGEARRETSIHSVAYVTREAADVMDGATRFIGGVR